MNNTLKRGLTKTFFQMLSDLNSKDEIALFWTDFLDTEEIETLIKRISIIYWIRKGRSEENIKTNLGATKNEVEKAKILLKRPGVKLAIKKLEAEEWANVWSEKIKNIGKFKKKQ